MAHSGTRRGQGVSQAACNRCASLPRCLACSQPQHQQLTALSAAPLLRAPSEVSTEEAAAHSDREQGTPAGTTHGEAAAVTRQSQGLSSFLSTLVRLSIVSFPPSLLSILQPQTMARGCLGSGFGSSSSALAPRPSVGDPAKGIQHTQCSC